MTGKQKTAKSGYPVGGGPIEAPETARLSELRKRAADIRAELTRVEAEVEQEQHRVQKAKGVKEQAPKKEESPTDKAAAAAALHHRPSYSILGGEAELEGGSCRQLGPADEDFTSVLKAHPELQVGPIGSYNHWDRRECAVMNPGEWKAACEKYMKDLGGVAEIPKVIHQIWIGPREPPCLWIDTFRVDYCTAYPDWKMELWSDEQVASLPMINSEIYEHEKMWQCKADILRLEFLWHHGGLYVDADMISVENRCLNQILEKGKDTGFVIAYEPDTKDKPYSILGNSVIGCTPHHPLILMLILFLKQTFYQKRNVIDVFAVTGPVLYTKCLVDAGMPISIADQELLYPAFHFVPNPDAIDYSKFPKCLMFQFGYTCSGLEGYVKRRNRCRKCKTCPFHKKAQLLDSYRKLSTTKGPELYGQVPIGMSYLEDYINAPGNETGGLPLDNGFAVFLTDGEICTLDNLRGEAIGMVDQAKSANADVLFLGIEFQTGADDTAVFRVPLGGRPKDSLVCALLVNVSGTRNAGQLKGALKACIGDKGFDPAPLFNAADRINLWFGVQKFATTLEESRIWSSMPIVHKIFTQIANHTPPLHFDRHEVHGSLVKGELNGRMAFEMNTEPNGGIMFRAWNDDNSPNCEMKTSANKVEWMKVFYNHQVSFEAQGRDIP